MAIRAILKMGDPRLLGVAKPVESFASQEIDPIIQDMFDTMKHAKGAGLAAPQIGIPLRIVIFGIEFNPRYPDAEPVPETILINPEIEILDAETEAAWEGCLSVPGMRGKVYRARKICYRGMSAEGEPFERVAAGFHARVVQHEVDHLDGVLYPRRIQDLREFGFIEELEQAGLLPAIKGESKRED